MCQKINIKSSFMMALVGMCLVEVQLLDCSQSQPRHVAMGIDDGYEGDSESNYSQKDRCSEIKNNEGQERLRSAFLVGYILPQKNQQPGIGFNGGSPRNNTTKKPYGFCVCS